MKFVKHKAMEHSKEEVSKLIDMGRKCDICGKAPISGNAVSHSNIKTRRKWNPNIRRVKAIVNGTKKRVDVCTRCLRSGKVTRAL